MVGVGVMSLILMSDSPAPSYYDPPDERHCPFCGRCDGTRLERRLAEHAEDCEDCRGGAECRTRPEECDGPHKTCRWHKDW